MLTEAMVVTSPLARPLVHFPGREGLDKPIVWVFPKLVVCLHCGLTEFTVPQDETRILREGIARSTAA